MHCTVIQLKYCIAQHHHLYKKIFKLPLRPKHHLLVHYPELMEKLGPLYLYSSIRFEAKHQFYKQHSYIVHSRKNILETLAIKNQFYWCHRLISEDGFDYSFKFSPTNENDKFNWFSQFGIFYYVNYTVIDISKINNSGCILCIIRDILLNSNKTNVILRVQPLKIVRYVHHVDGYEIKENENFEMYEIDFNAVNNKRPIL